MLHLSIHQLQISHLLWLSLRIQQLCFAKKHSKKRKNSHKDWKKLTTDMVQSVVIKIANGADNHALHFLGSTTSRVSPSPWTTFSLQTKVLWVYQIQWPDILWRCTGMHPSLSRGQVLARPFLALNQGGAEYARWALRAYGQQHSSSSGVAGAVACVLPLHGNHLAGFTFL